MSRVTSKYQVSIPKALAERYRLEPGDDVAFEEAGPVIRIVPPQARRPPLDVAERLRLFDEATARQGAREERDNIPYALFDPARRERGWTRDDLYDRHAAGSDGDSDG
ncbi:MAG: AbrB/MazE/SpoVT family DNA-binding domain-containing protein [Acidobacteriota bacterium]